MSPFGNPEPDPKWRVSSASGVADSVRIACAAAPRTVRSLSGLDSRLAANLVRLGGGRESHPGIVGKGRLEHRGISGYTLKANDELVRPDLSI